MRTLLTAAIMMAVPATAAAADGLQPLLETLQAVGPKGAGGRQAARAWRELVRADAGRLPEVLAALDDAGPLAANWIRTAVDTIAQRQLKRGGKLPEAELEKFVLDTRHAPRARSLAYRWLLRVDRSARERLLPGMLDDPSLELRRDAVARLIGQADALAKSAKQQQAADVYQKAFRAARDSDQVRRLAEKLKKLGRPVDLPRHFGFIVRWKLIGPFDNAGERGYHVAYPPEREIDPAASCDGKHGKVKWIEHVTGDAYGRVDLNKAIGQQKDVLAYAAAEFRSKHRREVEFRLTTFNAVKLWLNGKLIDQHNVYHGGSQMDQYVSRAVFRPGRNLILLKVCQNGQTQDWARHWYFQLRVCNRRGTAVLSEGGRQKGEGEIEN